MEITDLMSLSKGAKALGMSRQYLWMLIQMGRIPGVQIGKQYVVKREDLETYQRSKLNNN
jgi:excisionase family DNA binding protein